MGLWVAGSPGLLPSLADTVGELRLRLVVPQCAGDPAVSDRRRASQCGLGRSAVRAPLGETKDSILQRLPRTSTVLGLEVDLILRVFGEPASTPWTAYGHTLDAEQAALIQRDNGATPSIAAMAPDDDQDGPLFDALAADGRAPHARLAEHTGWSAARVKRRMAALEASGMLAFDVDLLPDRLGFNVNAMLWLTTPPRHLAAVAEQLAAHEEVATSVAISGRHNVLAVVVCRDVGDLYRYVPSD